MESRIPRLELLYVDRPASLPKRSLGCAILFAAIEDYHSLHAETHEHAKEFLYPRAQEWQEHFDWAVSLAENFDPQWLRETLDGRKGFWDQQRLSRSEERRKRRRLKRARRLGRG
jgi:hypothetical protein